MVSVIRGFVEAEGLRKWLVDISERFTKVRWFHNRRVSVNAGFMEACPD